MPALTLYRMSYDLYERIAEPGLLGPRDRVVLLDGFLVNQMPMVPTYAPSSFAAGALLGRHPGRLVCPSPSNRSSLRGGPDGDSAPQPDLAVVFGYLDAMTIDTRSAPRSAWWSRSPPISTP